MKVFLPRLLNSLQIGYYMVRVNQYRNGQALPITKRERAEFEGIAKAFGDQGKHPTSWEPGTYLIHKDQYGNTTEIIGMNVPESKEFIRSILGRF